MGEVELVSALAEPDRRLSKVVGGLMQLVQVAVEHSSTQLGPSRVPTVGVIGIAQHHDERAFDRCCQPAKVTGALPQRTGIGMMTGLSLHGDLRLHWGSTGAEKRKRSVEQSDDVVVGQPGGRVDVVLAHRVEPVA